MDGVIQDLRQAARGLLRTPVTTVAAVATLALGIGANTAIFSAVRGVLLRPLPFPDPGELVLLQEERPTRGVMQVSPGNYLDWRGRTETFESMAAWTDRPVNLATEEAPVRAEAAVVSGNFFRTLGLEAELGRTFDPAFRVDAGLKVVVLSHGLWRDRFGADPAVVGLTVEVDGDPHEVIGVTGPGMGFPEDAELWIRSPSEAPNIPGFTGDLAGIRTSWYFDVVGRLADGVELPAARAELDALAAALRAEHPGQNEDAGIVAEPLRKALVADARPLLLLLLGAVSLVLLVACVNVANLVLSRAEGRRHDFAVRSALGAGGGPLARFVLAEGMVLAGVGASLGVLMAWLGLPLLLSFLPDGLPRAAEIGLDAAVLTFAVAAAGLSCLLFTAWPAVAARSTPPAAALSGRGETGTRGRRRIRQVLVIGEIALAVVLAVGSGLVVRSVSRMAEVDPGIEAEGLAAVRVSLLDAGELTPEERRARWREIEAAVAGRPGVAGAGMGLRGPLEPGPRAGLRVVGRARAGVNDDISVGWKPVSPSYLPTLGVPVLRGRGLEPSDREGSVHVGVVNETLARIFFPGGDVLGRRITIGLDYGHEVEITLVGVVADTRNRGPTRPPLPMLYRPVDQADGFQGGTMTVVARVGDEMEAGPGRIQEAVRRATPRAVVYGPTTGPRIVAGFLGSHHFVLSLLGLFAVLAVSMGAVGIYGVMAHAVGRRRREIGIRRAVGASGRSVLGLVLGQGLALTVPGVVAGLAVSAVAGRALSAWLFEVAPIDPLTWAAVAAVLGLVGLAATLLPAREAVRLDPVRALRSE